MIKPNTSPQRIGSCQSSSFFGCRPSLGPGCCSVKMKASALSIVVPDDASISPIFPNATGSYWAVNDLGTRLTDGRDEISTSAMIVLFFRLNSNGKSVEVHFGQCTRPCHWLKRFHLVIRWGKIRFFVILRCSQTICFSGWSRHWKSWYFFRRLTRHDIIFWGEHGKIVWRHMNCWIIECKPWLILWWPFLFSYVFNFWGSHSLSVRHALSILWVPATELTTDDDGFLITGRVKF